MTNEPTANLFSLIKSLSPSEKRQFSLYIGRIGVNADSKFQNLFKIISRQKDYDENAILKKTQITKQQLPNVKAHLYKQILISLRLNPAHHSVPVQIREQMDFAYILYRKGLYKQSLKLLDKVKTTALYYEEKNVAFEILEWEKIIESQYITRSIHNRADSLIHQAEHLNKLNNIANSLSNLSLQLYGIFLKMGHARTEEEAKTIKAFFRKNLPDYDFRKLGFREKLWLYRAYLWFSFLTQDFISCYKYSSKWISLFKENPHLITVHPVLYLKGNNYLLESLFYLNHVKIFEKVLKELEATLKNPKIPDDDNSAALSFLYLSSNKLNLQFMKGEFANGQVIVDRIQKNIKKYKSRIDGHHIMVLYYKIACLYFGDGKYLKSIEYLQKIIRNKSLEMREDLLCFSRILNLVAHYEAGLDLHLDQLYRSTYRFLVKMNDLHEVQKELIKFLRNLPNISPVDLQDQFRQLHQSLKKYEQHPYERRTFLYLDINSWLESKIENRPVADIISAKMKFVNR